MKDNMQVCIIPIEQVIVGDRFREEYRNIGELVESFKTEGIIQPLAVKACDDNTFVLLAGGRRYKAAIEAKLTHIPVRVYPEQLNELEMRRIELMENACREDLTWQESTKLKKAIHELHIAMYGEKKSTTPGAEGWSKRDTATLLNISKSSVSDDVNLAEALDVFPELKEAKTKNDAVKMLKKLKAGVIQGELARRVQERTSSNPLDIIRGELCNRYIIGDFFEVAAKFPDKSFDILEVDPPYAIELQNIKSAKNAITPDLLRYKEESKSTYHLFLDRLIGECRRLVSDRGWVLMWHAVDPWADVVYGLLAKHGLKCTRLPAIWNKPGSNPTAMPTRHLGSGYDVFYYAAPDTSVINRQGRSNVFTYKAIPSGSMVHPAERPIELIEDVLSTFGWEGCRVCVPFAGSGNTLLAASNIGMTAVGTDLVAEYKDPYVLKVHGARPTLYKSYKGEEQCQQE